MISDIVWKKINIGGYCEYYDETCESMEKFIIPGSKDQRERELVIDKNWVVNAGQFNENGRRVAKGKKIPNTTYYVVADDGMVIDENVLGYGTLKDARHAAMIYLSYIFGDN